MGPLGEVEPLAEDEIERISQVIEDLGPESVAVCLLFSYLDPSHEERIANSIRERLPDVHVSASHEVLPRFREYERTSTTVIDAYLSPLLGRYLESLSDASGAAGIPAPEIMRSSGGVAPWAEAARQGAWSVLSGPAGGAVGAGLIARRSGSGDAVGLDMGGTSCDVCVIEDGQAQITESREIGGRVIQLPMVDVHTVGAGGGSVGWVDHGGALRVGPRSAGADPGPACYGRGGTEATVTDANLLLGRLAPGSSLAGEVALDRDAASRAIQELGRQARARRAHDRRGHREACELRDGASPPGGDRQPRNRPKGVRAASVRGRGPDARRRPRGRDGHDPDDLPASRGRAVRARVAGSRPPEGHGAHRDDGPGRDDRRAHCRRCARAARVDRGRHAGAARHRVVRAPIRGAVVRASGRSAARSRPARTSSTRSRQHTSAATASTCPARRSSWSRSALRSRTKRPSRISGRGPATQK